MQQPRLLILSPAPVRETDGGVILDAKFLNGIKQHSDAWPGPVTHILRRYDRPLLFGVETRREDLPCDLIVLDPNEPITEQHLAGHDIALASGDEHTYLNLSSLGKELGIKTVYSVEYTLETELRFSFLDPTKTLLKKIKAAVWHLLAERRRRRAFKRSDALQFNGYPAYATYGGLSAQTLLYLDNRMTPDLFLDDKTLEDKQRRLLSNAPLRLVYSGRLETAKGVLDLVPIAGILRDRGVDFRLDIFGSGSQVDRMQSQINDADLTRHVTLHDAVDFATELVPWARDNADVYLCCHKQSDPSCTYIENMGCGLAVVGYSNRMWRELCKQSGGGWTVPMNTRRTAADAVVGLDLDREELAKRCANALEFAKAHEFHSEFDKRMGQLKALVDAD